MPIQILPGQRSFGSRFGEGLGQGLAHGVSNLIQNKLSEMNQQKEASLFGKYFDPEFAQLLSRTDPAQRKYLLENYGSFQSAKNAREMNAPQQNNVPQQNNAINPDTINQIIKSLEEQQKPTNLRNAAPELFNKPTDINALLGSLKQGKMPLSPAMQQSLGNAQVNRPENPEVQNLLQQLRQLQQPQNQNVQAQNPGAPAFQPEQNQPPLFENAADKRARLARETEQEKTKIKDIQKFEEKVEEYGKPANTLYNDIDEIFEILQKGEAITGVNGRLTPTALQTEDGQRLEILLNDVVLQKDSALGGRNNVARLNLQKASKASIWNQPSTIAQTFIKTLEDEQFLKDYSRYKALEKFQDMAMPPSNYKQAVLDEAKRIKSDVKKKIDDYKLIKLQLDLPEDAYEGEEFKDTSTGIRGKIVNGELVRI